VSFSAGLVDIYAPAARADNSNVLNTPIKGFSVTTLDTHRADIELFCAVVRQTQKAGVCAGNIATGQWRTKKITLHMETAKVYEILNAVIAQNGQAAWTVIVPPDKLSKLQVAGLWHIYPLENRRS
jgi:hypothetical protein